MYLLYKNECRGKRGGRGKGGEMTQTLYAHMNKRKKRMNVEFLNQLKSPQGD
jgi:hypothetical protein